MHGVNDMELGDTFMADFDLVEKFRNNSSHMAAGLYGSVGDSSHQPATSSTIDDSHSLAGDQPAKVIGSLSKYQVSAWCGA